MAVPSMAHSSLVTIAFIMTQVHAQTWSVPFLRCQCGEARSTEATEAMRARWPVPLHPPASESR